MPKHRWDDDKRPLSKWQQEEDLEQRWQRKLEQARAKTQPVPRLGSSGTTSSPAPLSPAKVPTSQRKRGPTPDLENHAKVAKIISAYGDGWRTDDNLIEICEALDKAEVPIPKTWPTLKKHPARTWLRALDFHRPEVKKAIKYHCEAAAQSSGS